MRCFLSSSRITVELNGQDVLGSSNFDANVNQTLQYKATVTGLMEVVSLTTLVGVANKRHGMRKRSNRMLRQASGMKELSPGHAAKVIKQWLHG